MSSAPPSRDDALERWRLILGDAAEDALGPSVAADVDAALGFLYDRERAGRGERAPRDAAGGGASAPTVTAWLDEVHRLFPREAIERIEADAVYRYGLEEVLTDPALLERLTPSPALLEAVLRSKPRMSEAALVAARRLVARVVAALSAQAERALEAARTGPRDRRLRPPRFGARTLDLRRTVRRNLRGYDPTRRRIVLRRPYFLARAARRGRWQLVILVDQSGSMLGSAAPAAVTAACLHGLPSLRCHLASFDTRVVDLSAHVADPVELLMRLQLGGGTDIAGALGWARGVLDDPRRGLVVLISDLYEGGEAARVIAQVRALRAEGARLLVLGALEEDATPRYDPELARRLAEAGARVGAMTPGQLAAWVAEAVA